MAKRSAAAPKEVAQKQFTKKHLARAERERQQTRIIVAIAVGIGIILVGLISWALIRAYAIDPNIKVAQVDSTRLRMKEFQAEVTLRRWDDLLKYQQYQQYIQLYQSMGLTADSSLQNAVLNLQYEMSNKTLIGNVVLNKMVEDVLIAKEAAKENVTVSQAEVDAKLQTFFGYFANGTPTPTITTTPYITPTFDATQLAILATPTATPGATPTSTPTSAPTLSATPTIAGGVATATLEGTPTEYPTSTPYTLQGYQDSLKQYELTLGKTGLTAAQIQRYYYEQLLRSRMFDKVTASIPDVADQVWLRQIVASSEADTQKALDRFNTGENWNEIAAAVSTDSNTKDYGGDLGWFPKGASAVATEVETAAFEMKIGETRIVQSGSNWYLLQLAGKDSNRPIRNDYLQMIKQTAFGQWVQKLKDASNITTTDTWQSWIPALPTLPPTTTQ